MMENSFIVTILIVLAVIVAGVAWNIHLNSNPQNINPTIPFHFNYPGPPHLTLRFDGRVIKDSNLKVYHKRDTNGNIAYYWCKKNHHRNMPGHGVACPSHFHLDTINNVVGMHVDLINHNH